MKTKKQQELWDDVLRLTRMKNWEKDEAIVLEVQAKVHECESLSVKQTEFPSKSRSAVTFEVIKQNGTVIKLGTRKEVKTYLGSTFSKVDTAIKNQQPIDTGERIVKRIRQYRLYQEGKFLGEGTLKELASKSDYGYDTFMSKVYGLYGKYELIEIEPL